MEKATLILLQGRPATGKTTIGKKIAAFLGMPFFSRDDFKETIYDALGEENNNTIEWSKYIGALSFELLYRTMENILISNNSCVVETAWFPPLAEPKIKKILSLTHTNFLQIYLYCDSGVRDERFSKRAETARHPAHMDILRIGSGLKTDEENHPMLNIEGDVIKVDTTHFDRLDITNLLENIKVRMN